MKTKKINEKRRAQRIKVSLPIEYQLMPKKRVLIEKIFTRDISGGGIGLRLRYPLEEGMHLKTLLYFPMSKQPISSVSKVVWCEKRSFKNKTYFDVGIRHIKIASRDKERFVFLFCETMINYFVLPTRITVDEKKITKKSSHC
jgi:c-di-GMP-binding flagellar brake protein YcgR